MASSVWEKSCVLYKLTTMKWVWLTLPFLLMGIVLAAGGLPPLGKSILVLMGFMAARNAGMYVNRLIDKPIDKINPRTKNRILPKELISDNCVWMAALVNFILLVWAAYMLNPLCFYLSPLAIAAIIAYPYAKRFTCGLHILLGFVLAFAPVGAWIAISNNVQTATFVLALGVLLWCSAFDIILDNQDTEFYKQAGLHSMPARLGYVRSNQLALAMHIVSMLAFYYITRLLNLGFIYKMGLVIVAAFLAYEYFVLFKQGFEHYKKLAYGLNVGIANLLFLATLGDVLLLK